MKMALLEMEKIYTCFLCLRGNPLDATCWWLCQSRTENRRTFFWVQLAECSDHLRLADVSACMGTRMFSFCRQKAVLLRSILSLCRMQYLACFRVRWTGRVLKLYQSAISFVSKTCLKRRWWSYTYFRSKPWS